MLTAKSRVVVLGAGGHGSEIYAYIRDLMRTGWTGDFLGFLDDALPPGEHETLPILGSLAYFAASPTAIEAFHYLTAVGHNPTRRKLVERIDDAFGHHVPAWTLIHPSAFAEACEIGEGTLLAPHTTVNARTRIGRHCILNVKASVSHDCEVGDFVNLNPGVTICGRCRIGDGAYIGAGATVVDRIHIGEGAIVGAGAVVIRDIPAHVTAVGVPAQIIKTH